MREFKFIRGKYTDENIFNSDETNNCLFAYDSEGGLVEFTEKNNKEFQDKFAELSSDRLSEIYTLRPSQFTISATQKSDSSYDFTFEANPKVYDGSRQFPTSVIQKAEELIKANTTGKFNTESKLPILNLSGAAEQKTPMTFTFKDKPSFTRNLVFKVSGSLNERGYATAQGEGIDAYKTASGKIDYGSGVTKETFYGGRKQQFVEPVAKTVVSDQLAVGENTTLSVASKYTPADGYAFICGEGNGKHFDNEIKYGESSTFDLYKRLSYYLEASDADHAVTISKTFANTTSAKYTLNNNEFVSYKASPVEGTTYYEEGTSSNQIYASKVNNAPSAKLDTSAIEFVSGDAITVSPKDELIADAILFDKVTVKSNQLAYVKIDSVWTPIDVNQQVNVKFFIKSDNEHQITTFARETVANTYTVTVSGQSKTVLEGDIYCTMTYGGKTVSEFKYFNTSSKNKYIVKASVSEYLNGKAADDFVKMKVSVINTFYNLKDEYVAYNTNINLSTVYDNNLNAFYEYDVAKSEKDGITSTSYNFYHKVQASAYIRKKTFTVPAYGANTIVKGYSNSYSGYYIRDGNKLRSLADSDLTSNSISVYTKSDYHLFAGGAYENSNDTTNYVMWSDNDWRETNITSQNASVNGTVVSPIITNDVFRLIVDGTLAVTATQSD